jgi:perosamine synthetase
MTVIPIAEPSFGDEELTNVSEAVKSGWISSRGRFIPQFEETFSAWNGVKYGVATSNGTTALHMALVALGIGPGDEVIVPTLTFAATANVVLYTGARPVLVDSHPDYWCMDPSAVEAAVTPRTKAIIPVHLYGHPCDMDAISNIAKAHNLYIVEDAAESHGAEYKGRKTGSFGIISCFSFYGNKIITTGEGGMCLTDDNLLAEKMRVLRDHGMNPGRKYWHDSVGFNYRMTNMQAAVGVAQMAKIDRFIARKIQIAGWYREDLADLAEDEIILCHPCAEWAKCVYWMFSILVEQKAEVARDELIGRLASRGIESRPMFFCLHQMPPYSSNGVFPVAERLSRTGINLPSGVKLTRKEVGLVAKTVREILQSGA